MRVLGLVPARAGSRRVPDKNLARLEGRTLVRRALETALESNTFATVALSSESPEILAEAKGLDRVVRVCRPNELATDDALTYDVVVHALQELETGHDDRYDAVAVIQCTSPFTAPEDLIGAVEMLRREDAPSVVSIVRVEAAHHPLKLKRLEGDRLVPFIEDDKLLPSQALPPLWIRNGSVYVSRRGVIDGGELLAENILGYVMPAERSHDIDTPRDLALAELLLSRTS